MYKNGALTGLYIELHAACSFFDLFEVKEAISFSFVSLGPGPGGGWNMSMRPELSGMICFQFLLLSKKQEEKGGTRKKSNLAVGYKVEGNSPSL